MSAPDGITVNPALDPPINFDTCPVYECVGQIGVTGPPAAGPRSVRGTTSAGLPYPTAQDPLTNTDLYIKNLAQATDKLLDNRGFVTAGPIGMNTDGNGDVAFQFSQFSTLQGVVPQAYANYSDIWVLWPILTARGGDTIYCRWCYLKLGTNGYGGAPFASKGLYSFVIGWGVPKT